MQVRQLQHFETLYRLRSFGRAADEHRVTQSALSRSIKNLETELGQRLFDRTTHAVEPTDVAHGLIHHALDAIRALAAFDEEAGRIGRGTSGHVRIGCGPYPAQPLVTRTIRALSGSHAGIQVSVIAGTADALLAALQGRELEFVVCDMSKYEETPTADEIDVIALPSEALVAVLSAEHPMVRATASLERLAAYPFAIPTPAPVSTRQLPSPFAEAFASGRFPFYRLETTAACLDLARDARTITIVPLSLAKEACATGELVYRPAPANLRTNDGIHLLRGRTRSPSVRTVIAEVEAVATEIAAESAGGS